MPAVTRPTGVIITAPDTYRVLPDAPPEDRRGASVIEDLRTRAVAAAAPGALRHALEHLDIAFIDRVELVRAAASGTALTETEHRPRGVSPPSAIRVDVHTPDDAALLVEIDAGYSWSLPVSSEREASRGRLTRSARPAAHIHTFIVHVTAQTRAEAPDRIVIYVLTFATPRAAARAPSPTASPADEPARAGGRPGPSTPLPPPAAAPLPPAAAPARPPAPRPRRGLDRTSPPVGAGPAPIPAPAAPSTAGAPSSTTASPTRIECHVLAEMEPEVVLGATATIEVSLSREWLTPLGGRLSAAAGGQVDPTRTLIVQVVPRLNMSLAPGTADRVEVDPPAEGVPRILYFDVTARHPGPAEVWVIVRQHQMGVARVVLKPSIVTGQSPAGKERVATEADVLAAPALARPLDQLSIFEQTIGDRVHYLFELEMPSINVFGLHASPPLDVPRDEYVARLYKEIDDRYVSTYDAAARAADVAAFTAELQAYGAVLFDRLFPSEIQELLWTHRDAIRSVRVVSTEPFIPWEIVHLREPGRPLDASAPARFLGQMGLVRWLHNVDGLPPAALRVRPGRARYVIPEYVDPALALPAALNERLYLERTFGATPIDAQPVPLRDALATPGAFDLLHIACHGEADSSAIDQARLVLAGRDEGEVVRTYLNVSTVETFARLRAADGAQPIVFLNACQAGRAGYQLTGIGGFAQAFLRAGAGAFVGTLWSVDDQPAFFFGRAFYEALRRGATMAEAAVTAREAARRDDATWLAYVVYAHPHATLV